MKSSKFFDELNNAVVKQNQILNIKLNQSLDENKI